MKREQFKMFVEQNPNLVSMRPVGEGLYILKYKKKVFFDNLWNEFLEECRGTIVNSDFYVISRPFTKIYNYGVEAKAPIIDDNVLVNAYRKINGFMVAVTWDRDRLLISTTGSTDSDYVTMAKELIDEERFINVCKSWYGVTFMFECVHKNDPHIIPEQEGMYLLGYRPKDWSTKVNPNPKILKQLEEEFGTIPVEHYRVTMAEVKKMAKECKHEGFVFYTDLGEAAKIKSPYYLIKKFVARNPRTDKLMRKDIKNSIDEEYYPLIDAIQANIEEYTAMDEQQRLSWVRSFLEK